MGAKRVNSVEEEILSKENVNQNDVNSGEGVESENNTSEQVSAENLTNQQEPLILEEQSCKDTSDDSEQQQPEEHGEEYWKDRYLRLLSEFDNYRKNIQKQIADQRKYEGEGILREIIEIVDDLERALSYASGEQIKSDPVLMGVQLTLQNFLNTLKRFGVECFSVVGKEFDPLCMDAIERVEDPEQPDGTVVKEFKKLYRYKDKVLRFAEVAVVSNSESKSC